MMEDEEAQAVLLEGMEGEQYITIQRTDGETLDNQPFMTINMVTEMINEVGTEYNTGTQYYETDDLLAHEMTEEDRKLAEALVAVQLQQQHKQQAQHDDPPLPDVSQLATLSPVNTYAIQSIPATEQPPVYSTLQSYKIINHNVKQEFINVKSEYDIEVSADSSEDAAPSSGPKRSLPHKKRIARKLKQQTKKNTTKKDVGKTSQEVTPLEVPAEPLQSFKCEICESQFGGQLKFFEHLKTHYEPVKQETRIAHAANPNISISATETVQTLEHTVIEEFSEPEDLMEGIRGVVEETGAHTDDETETSSLRAVDNNSTLWAITNVTQSVQEQTTDISTINEQDLQSVEEDSPAAGETTKGGKASKPKKAAKNQWTCPQCERTFHHKNSLIYHLRSHTGERPHQCEICGKSFFAASALKVHKRLHSGDKPYKCEDCGRHFRQWGDLKYHSMSLHSEQRQFQCEYCGKDFARKYSLIVHRRIHTGEKNYKCEYCNKTFRASSYLQNHRRIHTGEKPHPCTICGKPFRVRSDMKRHMHTHTRGRAERPATRVTSGKSVDEDDKNFQARTIQDLVEELKLEAEPNNVVEIVPPEDNPESILPHEGGQTLEYTVTNATEGSTERDPLEAVDRSSDTMKYFFTLPDGETYSN